MKEEEKEEGQAKEQQTSHKFVICMLISNDVKPAPLNGTNVFRILIQNC